MTALDRRRATVAVLAAAMLFGTTGTALARFEPDASPNGTSALRLLIGSVTLCAVAALDPVRRWSWRGSSVALACGGAAVAAYQLCFFVGTTRTGVALATVLTIGSGPVFSGVIDAAVFGRRPTRSWSVGTALGITGVVILLTSRPTATVDGLGVLAALGSGLGWAVYATVGKVQIGRGVGPAACMAAMFTVGAVLLSPWLLLDDVRWAGQAAGFALAAYLGVITVGAAYTLYGHGLRHLPAPAVITLTLAEPITAALLSVLVLHEPIPFAGWLGIAVVLVALVVTTRGASGSGGADPQPVVP